MGPLVSVCIITYNSQSTIIQTLDSIKNQTYKNIELIISDDGSNDDTTQIINSWLKNNKTRFCNSKLIAAKTNQGIASNLHTAIINSNGEWIKILAGDDLLSNDCIDIFVENVTTHPGCSFFTCNVNVFTEEDNYNIEDCQFFYDYLNFLQHKPKKTKQRISIYKLIYPGPEWFFSRKLYNSVGGIDLNFSMLDELPFIYKVIQMGYEIIPLKNKLVLYRVCGNSASRISTIKRIFYEQNYRFYKTVQLPTLRKKFMLFEIFDQNLSFFLQNKQIKKFDKTGVYDYKLYHFQCLSIVTIISKIQQFLFKHSKKYKSFLINL